MYLYYNKKNTKTLDLCGNDISKLRKCLLKISVQNLNPNGESNKGVIKMNEQHDSYENKKYEIRSLKTIEKWEKQKYTGVQKQFQDMVSKPIDYIVQKVGEEKFNRIEKAIQAVVEKLLYASRFTVNPERIVRKAKTHGIRINDISDLKNMSLKFLDACNQKEISFHTRTATLHGAIAGIGGELLATVDLTTLIIQDFHMIQNIAYCYGFDPDDLIEKQIILRIIEGGIGGSDIKFKILKDIEELKQQQENQSGKRINAVSTKFIDRYAKKITVAMIARIISCSLPILAMAVSAHSNRDIINQSSETALMVYRKRFIARRSLDIIRPNPLS